ncbi:unnamed protein product, partial [Iphiclides podalirius]
MILRCLSLLQIHLASALKSGAPGAQASRRVVLSHVRETRRALLHRRRRSQVVTYSDPRMDTLIHQNSDISESLRKSPAK